MTTLVSYAKPRLLPRRVIVRHERPKPHIGFHRQFAFPSYYWCAVRRQEPGVSYILESPMGIGATPVEAYQDWVKRLVSL